MRQAKALKAVRGGNCGERQLREASVAESVRQTKGLKADCGGSCDRGGSCSRCGETVEAVAGIVQ